MTENNLSSLQPEVPALDKVHYNNIQFKPTNCQIKMNELSSFLERYI
jgi:hypothetical protein